MILKPQTMTSLRVSYYNIWVIHLWNALSAKTCLITFVDYTQIQAGEGFSLPRHQVLMPLRLVSPTLSFTVFYLFYFFYLFALVFKM